MATTQSIIDYYAALLILQYLEGSKNYAFIQTIITPVIMDQLPTQVQNAYNVTGANTAVGVQLDVIGKYAGVTRSGYGFNGQPITLSDADFLTLIQFAIIKNSAQSSLAAIQELIAFFFPGKMLVFDYTTMQMSYLISSSLGSLNLIELVVTEGLLPKPMAVGINAIIFAPIINAFFGFRTYTAVAVNSSPFNDYTSYQTDWPWLSYSDAIVI